jgi:transcriptional regulator with XRE-family HTH domain
MYPDQKYIGSLIREYRLKKNMTQGELANLLGHATPQFISFCERGLSKVPFSTLGQLIVILGIPEKTLMNELISAYEESLKEAFKEGKQMAKKRA